MDTATGALIGVVAANVLTLCTLLVKDWSAGRREERHRKWDVEDRTALALTVASTASTLASKVEKTSDTLASKVADTSSVLAAKVSDTSSVLAAKVEATSSVLAAKVEQQAVVSSAAADKIIELLRQAQEAIKANTEISTNAFHEANGAKLALAEEVRRRNELHTAAPHRNVNSRERADDAAKDAELVARVQALEAGRKDGAA